MLVLSVFVGIKSIIINFNDSWCCFWLFMPVTDYNSLKTIAIGKCYFAMFYYLSGRVKNNAHTGGKVASQRVR